MKMPLYAPLGAVVTPIPRHFATWRKTTNTKQLLRIRSLAQKSFGEAFGAATGVSDPRLQSRTEEETSALLLFSQAPSIQTQRQNSWPVFMDYKMVEARGVEPLS